MKLYKRTLVLLLVSALVVSCGGGDGGGNAASETSAETGTPETTAESSSGGDAESSEGDDGAEIIRFGFAPDPVWDYLNETGELAKWEEEHNIQIETSSSWDKFAYFAGGHGDTVSMGTDELPLMEDRNVGTVAFGAYNHQRVPLFRRAGDPYETLADVPKDSKICVSGPLSNTIVWSVIADQLHGLDYRVGGGDFDLVVQDHFVMPELLVRGECEVAAFIPEAAIPLLREGEIEQMYEDRQPWQVYQEVCECDHQGIMSNLMVATEEWYDSHEEEAASFLALWETGLQLWHENKPEIISLYPQHFSVEAPEDIEYITEYMSGDNDWFVDTVYIDDEWIEQEMKFYDYMIDGGWIEQDLVDEVRFEAIDPTS